MLFREKETHFPTEVHVLLRVDLAKCKPKSCVNEYNYVVKFLYPAYIYSSIHSEFKLLRSIKFPYQKNPSSLNLSVKLLSAKMKAGSFTIMYEDHTGINCSKHLTLPLDLQLPALKHVILCCCVASRDCSWIYSCC